MKRYIRIKHGGWARVEDDTAVVLEKPPWDNPSETGLRLPFDEDSLMAPVIPSKIVLVGLNYREHIKESQWARAIPEEPIIFLKPPTAIIGPGDIIPYPEGLDRVDYEGELAGVIGEKMWRASEK